MLNSYLLDRIKLPFRKDKELYSSLYKIIGFYPHNIEYYKQALMHKSLGRKYTKKGQKPINNERLEFLGDAVLDCIVGDIVYRHFPKKHEGFLTNTRSKIVQRDTLNKLAHEMEVVKLVKTNGFKGSHNSYMGGNAFEALVGAIYLDRGFDACMRFMKKRILAQIINIDKVAYKVVNFKSKLLEWSQKNRIKIEFQSKKQEQDKDGSPKFYYVINLEQVEGCEGEGYSKKEAQQEASRKTLDRLRKDPKFLDSVFASKTMRTKMEEEPVQTVPSTSADEAFMTNVAEPERKRTTASTTRVYSQKESAADNIAAPKRHAKVERQPKDDFDLSDISAKAKTEEQIIAEAEAAAFKQADN